jgi:hypothetical protein
MKSVHKKRASIWKYKEMASYLILNIWWGVECFPQQHTIIIRHTHLYTFLFHNDCMFLVWYVCQCAYSFTITVAAYYAESLCVFLASSFPPDIHRHTKLMHVHLFCRHIHPCCLHAVYNVFSTFRERTGQKMK